MLIILGCIFLIISGLSLIALFFGVFYCNLLVGDIMRTLHLRWRLSFFMKKTLPEVIQLFRIGGTHKFLVVDDNLFKPENVWVKLGYYLWGYDIFMGKVPMIKLMIFCNIVMWIIK